MVVNTGFSVHQAPLFLCAPAKIEAFTEEAQRSYRAPDSPFKWQPWQSIRAKVLDHEEYDELVLQIIKNKAAEWIDSARPALELIWVKSDEEAEVRISFHDDIPSWSCRGSQALAFGPDEATMNYSLGGWDTNRKDVFSHAHIGRIASHLFGHVFGLPHAQNKWTATWDEAKLAARLGPIAQQIVSHDTGSHTFPNTSIMHYDLPASLSRESLKDDRQGSLTIDDATKSWLQGQYPRPPDVYYRQITAQKKGTETTASAAQRIDTTMNTKGIIALNRIDFDKNHNWRIKTSFDDVKSNSYKFKLGGWDDTILDSASCDIMSFDATDMRVQSGRETYSNNTRGERGTMHILPVKFVKPYARTPEIVHFISGFDTSLSENMRFHTEVQNVSKDGFNLALGSWTDTWLYDLQVFWLAYDSQETAFRSGLVATETAQQSEKMISVNFKYAMPVRPRAIFHGFTRIDIDKSQNPRCTFEVTSWTNSGFQARFASWGGANYFYQLTGSYLAII